MIIQYYRSNQPVLLLTVPVLGIVLWSLHFFDLSGTVSLDGYVFEKVIDIKIPLLVSKTLAVLLICLQAFLINQLISESEVFSKPTHIPLLITVLMGTILSHQGMLDAAIIGNVFIILALRSLLRVYHQNSVIGLAFNIGFWIGVAALFEPAYIFTVLAALIAILILRASDWRELFFLFTGSVLPHFFLWTICFLLDITYSLPENYFQFEKPELPFLDSGLFVSFLILTAVLVLFSFVFYLSSLKGTILRIRKMRTALIYFMLVLSGTYSYLLFTSGNVQYNEILLLPVSLLLSYLYIQSAKTILTDTCLYLLTGLWAIFVYNLYLG